MTHESAMNAPIQQEQPEAGIYQQATLGVFGRFLIFVWILITAGWLAFGIYTVWPMVVVAFN